MYEFPRFAAPSREAVVDLVRTHPFAVIITANEDGAPVATHAPVIMAPSTGSGSEELVGATLIGHFARANEQWQTHDRAREALLIFSGPDGYVSPTTYGTHPSAPTWDYAAVHLTGQLEWVEERDDCLQIVRDTVQGLEELEGTGWDPDSSIPYFERIVEYIVGFRFRVTGEKALFKLSQDKPADVRQRVIERARERELDHSRLASMMERTPGAETA